MNQAPVRFFSIETVRPGVRQLSRRLTQHALRFLVAHLTTLFHKTNFPKGASSNGTSI